MPFHLFLQLTANWPKLLGPFITVLPPVFDVYMFRMSFYIISVTKKSDIIFVNCVLDQFNAAEST